VGVLPGMDVGNGATSAGTEGELATGSTTVGSFGAVSGTDRTQPMLIVISSTMRHFSKGFLRVVGPSISAEVIIVMICHRWGKLAPSIVHPM
jgi:hypothetical protein